MPQPPRPPDKAAGPSDPPRPAAEDEPVLPQGSRDERDVGWGDEPDDLRRDGDWYRRERPPHHE